MKELSTDGKYEITPAMKEELKDFYGGYATEDETFKTIADLFNNASYLIDTHTAVAAAVYDKYKKEIGDKTATVIASTASPYKFTRSVMNALGKGDDSKDDFALADELSTLSGVAIPEAVTSIRNAEIRHKTVVEKTEMESAVKSFLGI